MEPRKSKVIIKQMMDVYDLLISAKAAFINDPKNGMLEMLVDQDIHQLQELKAELKKAYRIEKPNRIISYDLMETSGSVMGINLRKNTIDFVSKKGSMKAVFSPKIVQDIGIRLGKNIEAEFIVEKCYNEKTKHEKENWMLIGVK